MRVAIIPPRGYERHALLSDYQLMLPKELERPEYARVYLQAKERGDYLILDNGAAEDQLTDIQTLVRLGHQFNVDEIVIPDVLGNMNDTLQMARDLGDFLMSIRERHPIKFVGVIQGQNDAEAVACYEVFASMPWVDRIMLPRHMANRLGMSWRVDFAERMMEKDLLGRFGPAHCLGSSDYWREPCLLSDHPGIRGIDTSLIHGATYAGFDFARCQSDDRPDYRRDKTYFTAKRQMYSMTQARLDRNLKAYGYWANNEHLRGDVW